MATFEKRGKFWRVKVRRAGLPAQAQSFDSKLLAQQWARSVEADIDKGSQSIGGPPSEPPLPKSSSATDGK